MFCPPLAYLLYISPHLLFFVLLFFFFQSISPQLESSTDFPSLSPFAPRQCRRLPFNLCQYFLALHTQLICVHWILLICACYIRFPCIRLNFIITCLMCILLPIWLALISYFDQINWVLTQRGKLFKLVHPLNLSCGYIGLMYTHL